MWANMYIPGDVIENLIAIVVRNAEAFNTRLCVIDWHAIGMKHSVFTAWL